MEMRGLMGGFYKLSEWIMRLAVINLLWLICSLPFWFFLFVSLLANPAAPTETAEQAVLPAVIVLAVLAPFTFFPSTSAMFSVARKWVTGDVEVPLFRTFFRSYKTNFKQAMIGGILYALLFAVLFIDFRVYLTNFENIGIIAYLFLALMLLLLVSVHHFFSLLAHFHMKTLQLLKNAVILTIGRPLRSLFMTAGTVAVLAISTQFTWLIPFFFGSIIATFAFYNFNLIVAKMMANAEKSAADRAADGLQEEEQEMKS